ncbi:MAG TPA: mannose-1-phosphate guanylyltransferase [Gemmatimonadaceae bacterium]|nr:mannose-1-phosphate guanylyltransferase [Gemmatimonadaceae bacterium]
MNLWVVILAGGVGSRFWPLSTPTRPKQLLPLVGDRPLLVDTVERIVPLAPAARTLILTNAELAAAVRTAVPDIPAANVLAEPRPAGTAAALAWAAREIRARAGAEAVMLCVHADWAVADAEGFRTALRTAATVAEREHGLVTVGIVPTRPEIGYGYIQPGEPVAGGARRVARFVEKPNRSRAEQLCAAGCLWNSGIFAWRVGDFLDEIARHTPEVAPALAEATDATAFFEAVTPVTVDVGVLERSDRVFVVPGDFGWDDVGTWAALARVRRRDAHGNAASGPVHALAASDNVVHAEGNAVVLYGVEGLVVVARPGVTLVTTVDRAAELKTLLDSLPDSLREPA